MMFCLFPPPLLPSLLSDPTCASSLSPPNPNPAPISVISDCFSAPIAADHAGGTHWYHAHHHGSTALQAGGGLAGALIVEDLTCDVPQWVSNLGEQTLMIQDVAPQDLNEIGTDACCDLWTTDFVSPDANFLLVNGQLIPNVSIVAGQPTRLRMIYAAILDTVQLSVETAVTDL